MSDPTPISGPAPAEPSQAELTAALRASMPREEPNIAAGASLVLGLFALFCLGFITGIPALVAGAVGISRSNLPGTGGRRLAIAGLLTGALGCAWSAIWLMTSV